VSSISVALALGVHVPAAAADAWQPARALSAPRNEAPVLSRVVSADDKLIEVAYRLPAVRVAAAPQAAAPGAPTGARITLGNAPDYSRTGQPVVPFVPVILLLPDGHEVATISVQPDATREVPGTHILEHGQTKYPLSRPAQAVAAQRDAAVYASDAPYPGTPYEVIGVHRKRGAAMLYVNVFPLQYHPLSGRVTCWESFTVSVTTKPAAPSPIRYRPDPELPVERRVENPASIASYAVPARAGAPLSAIQGICNPTDSFTYVIISSAALRDATTDYTLRNLKAHRLARGVSATIVTLEDIYANYTGDNAGKVREFIKDAYNNWETDYVLLAGDTGIVPLKKLYVDSKAGEVDNIPADLYYQCLDGAGPDGDIVAEVYIGRASADSAAEMANWVYKTLAYELDLDETGYKTGNLMVGEHLGFGGESEYAKPSMQEIRYGATKHGYTTMGFTNAPKWRTDTLYEMDGGWSGSTIKGKFNANAVSMVNHLGHCNYTYCMKMYNSDYDGLVNTKFMFGYSQGCMPGGYDTDCAGEHATTSTRYGFFAVIWNARYGWGEFNSTDGPSQRFHRPFWHCYFAMDYVTLGAMNCYAHEANIPIIEGECIRWCYYESNLMGDPMTPLPWAYRPPDAIPPVLLNVAPPDWTITGRAVPMAISATDNVEIAAVTVNGNAATGSGSNWSYTASLTPWTNSMLVIAKDRGNNAATQLVHYVFIPDAIRPVITAIQPASGYSTSAAAVPMTVGATDNVMVAGVTVNGSAATKVGGVWNYTLPVLFGMNVARVVAEDAEHNAATQTVYYTRLDVACPVIGDIAPPSGFTTTNYAAAMTITASDNAGVTALTVNGNPASFLGSEQWACTPPLVVGSNQLTVIARDADMNAATAVVHYINNHTPTHYVAPSGGHAYPYNTPASAARDIQTALVAADIGDTIIVADGVYDTQTVTVDKQVTLRSANGTAGALIDGAGARRCLAVDATMAVVDGFTLSNGVATTAGGGLNLAAGTVRNCLIIGNRSLAAGGGAALAGGLLADSTIQGNTAVDGAGVDCAAGTLHSCIIRRNTADNYGGGIRFNQNGTLVNSYVVSNAANFGGGVYCYYGGTLTNCTIAGNTAAAGAGIRCNSGGVLHNSVIYHNNGGNVDCNGGASFSFCCCTPMIAGEGNLSADPCFLAMNCGGCSLRGDSPCVNAGSNDAWMVGAYDLAGNPRIIGGSGMKIVDMGAFEATNVPDETVHYASPSGSHRWPFVTWATAATNIQDAINEAAPGERVLVTDAVYHIATQLIITAPVTVASVNGAAGTVIDALGAGRCALVRGAVLDGFTLRNGAAASGGAVRNENGTVCNCSVADSAATVAGGGIYAAGGVVSNCVVAGNTAPDGAGIFAVGTALVIDSRAEANTADYTGGGLSCSNGTTLLRVTLAGNAAAVSGGGLRALSGAVAQASLICNNTAADGAGVHAAFGAIITDCAITGNMALTSGGGAWLDNGGLLRDSVLCGNTAAQDAGGVNNVGGLVAFCTIASNRAYNGGGAKLVNGSVENCSVDGNRANNYGGGVHLYFGGTLLNSLMTRNHATFGGGAYCYYGGTLTNCTLAGNTATSAAGVRCNGGGMVNNSIMYYNNGANYLVSGAGYGFSYCCLTPSITGAGNTTNDPLFINRAAADYRLPPGSPCVNAGQSAGWMAAAQDVAGVRRVVGGAVDIGAYEEAGMLPLVDVTNTDTLVEFDVAVGAIGGTNNAMTVGGMRWTNSKTGGSGVVAAAPSWTIPAISLGIGVNVITVTGTNAVGDAAADRVAITRSSSSAPFVDITNSDVTVAYEVSACTVAGTNNAMVVGAMSWINSQGSFGTLAAAAGWSIPAVPLVVGVNQITVAGTNRNGTAASDVVYITRQGPDVGMPFVDVTNAPMTVPFGTVAAVIGGTNNPHVVGIMTWSNSRGGAGALLAQPAWSVSGIPLEQGNNIITVAGTNIAGTVASDTVLITRLGEPVGQPLVDITAPDAVVSNDVLTCTIHGTNNAWVVGGMDWECYVGSERVDAGATPAQSPWTISGIEISDGINEIVVWGTNAVGDETWDTVHITRVPGVVPQCERFSITLAADGLTPILSWSNAAASVLVCTNTCYTTNAAAWFTRAANVLSPWPDGAAGLSKAVYYRLATATATSGYDVGKLTLDVRQGDGLAPAQNWIATPFDFVDRDGNVVPSLPLSALGVAPAVNNETRVASMRDSIYSQNQVGGEVIYASRGNGVWYTATPDATNWFRNRMYKVVINKAHTGAAKPLTLVGRVTTANSVHVADIQQSDGVANRQNWVAAWFPWIVGVNDAGVADVVTDHSGSPANRDAFYSQDGTGGATMYATRGVETWHTSTPLATNLCPGHGYIILIKRNHTGPLRQWQQQRRLP
jgi:hypothetical protein